MRSTAQLNRLAESTSPYLRQHAANPVDWHPWSMEALELARLQHKPILLSIGYSACHWCHVMAHESFENEQTAQLMNRLFVNIKVDREERPDLDKIYQTAHQLLAQRPGGWPLTMFLSPDDLTPFFGGTYFPDETRHGLPAFRDLLENIARAYEEHGDDIKQQNSSMREALDSLNPTTSAGKDQLNATPLSAARKQLEDSFDQRHGGFGKAPKFPHPTNLEFLLRHWYAGGIDGNPDAQTLHMPAYTLKRMALGGINDQLGGGFCRYSVDDLWMIPHFEKMLYDNGPLLSLYVDVWSATGDALFARTAHQIARWVMREMQSPEGGYYSSLDADSEGEEGKFYVWTRAEVEQLLEEDELRSLTRRYGLDRQPNFEGAWHLHTHVDIPSLAKELQLDETTVRDNLERARAKLFSARQERVAPGRDDKVLTSWNALMIKSMARAGRLLQQPEYIDSASQAMDFIHSTLLCEGRLLATYKDGKAHLSAYLDDYAFLIDALLELLQARWRRQDLDFCTELAELMLHYFEDRELGGFYFTASDHETLIHRPKPLGDDATPSGNGIAASVLIRLGHLLGENRYLDAAQRTLQLAWNNLAHMPYAHCSLLLALQEHLQPTEVLVLRGNAETLTRWQARASERFVPNRICLAIPDTETELPGLLGARSPQGDAIAYLCSGTQCHAPITEYAVFDRKLQLAEKPGPASN